MNTITYRSLCLALALFVFGLQPSLGQVGVELPQITEDTGEDITIPVRVDTLDGYDVTSYQFTLPYDSSILSLADSIVTDGTLTPSSADVQVVSDEGELRVSVASQTTLSGGGTLVKLRASLVAPGTAPLSFSNFQLFDVDGNEVATSLEDGEVVAEVVSVSLPQLTADVGETVQLPIEVDTLDGKDVTSYQFTLPYDASVLTISEDVVVDGTLTPSSADVQVATEEGEIRVSVAAQEPITGAGTLLELSATLENSGTAPLSFSDVALFDSDGDEVFVESQDGEVVAEGIVVSLPEVTRDAGSSVELPIDVEDLSGEDVTSYQFTLPYDASVVSVTDVNTDGTVTPSSADIQVSTQDGQISVSVAAQEAFSEGGVLLNLEARLVGAGTAALSFSNFQLFDSDGSEVATTLRDGQVVSEPLAVSLPNRTDKVGKSMSLSVTVDTLDGRDVTSYQFTLPYDASVVTISGVDTEGTRTPSSADVQVATEEGEIRVSVATQQALTGVGTLLNLNATLEDAGTAALSFSNFQAFNSDGDEVVTETEDGELVSQGVVVSLPMRSAKVGDSVSLPITVDTLNGKNATSYQFTLPYDASVLSIADSVTTEGTLTPSSADVQVATEQGEIRVSVAAQEAITGSGALLELHATAENKGETGLDFSNFDLFDADGESVAVTLQGGMFTTSGIEVRLPIDTTSIAAGSVTLPIDVEDVSDFNVTSYQFTLPYDASILTISSVNTDGTLTPSSADIQVATEEGEIRVSVAAQQPFTGSGTLLNLEGTLEGTGTASLSFSSIELFDEDGNGVATSPQDGQLVVSGNAPPTFTSVPGDTTAQVGQELSLQVEASDPEGDDVTFNLLQAPDGATINSTTGEFTWTPSEAQADSSFSIGVRASDGQSSSDATFTVTVGPANRPPEITSVPSGSVEPVQTFQGQVEATDPDGDDLSYSLDPDPDNASIDDTGAFQFTPTCLQRDSEVSFTVTVSDGRESVEESFTITVEPISRQAISVNINRTFDDATEQTNYRLVGLPGQVNRLISRDLEGESGSNNEWRAFWDNGSSGQSGLVEFDGSSQFNFRPGRGFWLLSRNAWSVSGEFEPVALNNSCSATVSLHDGWNIISNPFGKAISWSAVQSANGVSAPLWGYNRGFSQASNFASAQNGQAYYFLNDQGLSQLSVPFFEGAGTSQTEKADEETPPMLTLTTRKDDHPTSTVHLGLRPESKTGKDEFDHFAPPSYFEAAALRAENDEIDSEYKLASDVRPMEDAEGRTFKLTLSTRPGTELTIDASGVHRFAPSQQLKLFHSAESKSYDLRTTPTIDVTPASEESSFIVMIGSESYVESKQSELVPQKVKLHQNYPNPFRDQTTLRYAIPEEMEVRVEVYDLLGRRIKTLVHDRQSAGVHTLQWSGDSNNGQLASGTYLVRLQAGDQMRTMKMVLVK